MDDLSDIDLVDPGRLQKATEECAVFHGFLNDLFEKISQRDVLVGVPFDRRAAAAPFALYLGSSRGAATDARRKVSDGAPANGETGARTCRLC
jgi:hypothetical protein